MKREFYRYNNISVSGGESQEKKARLIGKRGDNSSSENEEENSSWGFHYDDEQNKPQLMTADSYGSSGQRVTNSRPRIASKWGARRYTSPPEQEEAERKRRVEADISEHSRSLRENPATTLKDWSEYIPE
jgi:hypothetical protein